MLLEKFLEIKVGMKLKPEFFPTIDLSILENEATEHKYYSTAYIYIESATYSHVYCRHDKELSLQIDYLNYERKYLDFFELVIEENWPCFRVLENSQLIKLENKTNFLEILQSGLREELPFKDDDITFSFILYGLDCIIHVGFDLGLLIYYTKETESVKKLLKQFYGAGFSIE